MIVYDPYVESTISRRKKNDLEKPTREDIVTESKLKNI